MYDFKEDLPFGEEFEKKVAKLLSKRHILKKAEGYHPAYDLKCDHCGITIECKRDRKTKDTGNIILESKLLNDSEADFLLYDTGDGIYWGELEDIRYWVKLGIELGFNMKRVVGENNTEGYIIPLSDTIIYMTKLAAK